MRSAGFIVLAVWLVLTGLMAITDFDFPSSALIMGILAIAAGVLLLLDARPVGRGSRKYYYENLGVLLLALWLILTGLVALVGPLFDGSAIILAILAIAAGIALVIRR